MQLKIFQIDMDKDNQRVKFESFEETKNVAGTINPAIYAKVFDGNVCCNDLEEVFDKFNQNIRSLEFAGHSMSVSDVVLADNKAYFCDTWGFKEIDFDESKVKSNMLKILIVEPGKEPYPAMIHDTLEDMQKVVGGLIEPVYPFADNAFIFANDEGKILGLEGNRQIGNHILCGTFFVVGDTDEGECCSLTDEQIKAYSKFFENPQEFTQQEIEDDTYIVVTTLE